MSGDDKRAGNGEDGGDQERDAGARNDAVDDEESRRILEGSDGGSTVPPTLVEQRRGRIGGRLAGTLAAVLGLLGCLLSFALLAIAIRSGFLASDVADTTAEPLTAAVDRLETRIDQADDLIDRDGVSGPEFSELQARLDGLADTSASASQAFSAIDDHILYRWLPIDKSELSMSLADFKQGADESVGIATTADSLSAVEAGRIGDRINGMQTSVSGTGDLIESTVDSLTNWIRVSALAGFLLALWSLWAQTSLMKRGWRGMRGERR